MVNVLKLSWNTCLFLFSNKVLVIRPRAGMHKILVNRANREDPDQTTFSESV